MSLLRFPIQASVKVRGEVNSRRADERKQLQLDVAPIPGSAVHIVPLPADADRAEK